MDTAPDGALAMPVGHDLGDLHGGDGGPPTRRLRIGARVVRLTEPQSLCWTMAHGTAGAPPGAPQLPCTIGMLRRGFGDDVVEDLRVTGVLASVEPGSARARTFAERHRLLPLTVGVVDGEGPRATGVGTVVWDPRGTRPPRRRLVPWPRRQHVGTLSDRTVAVLDDVVFELWRTASTYPDLLGACAGVAGVVARGEAGTGGPDLTDPDAVLTRVLERMHTLTVVRAACLDVRVAW